MESLDSINVCSHERSDSTENNVRDILFVEISLSNCNPRFFHLWTLHLLYIATIVISLYL